MDQEPIVLGGLFSEPGTKSLGDTNFSKNAASGQKMIIVIIPHQCWCQVQVSLPTPLLTAVHVTRAKPDHLFHS